MILDGNVLCSWCKLGTFGNLDATFVVFVDLASEHGFSRWKIKYLWDFLQKVQERDDLSHSSRQCNVFALCCAESDFRLKLALPSNWTTSKHNYKTGSWQYWFRAILIAIFPATCKVCVNITFEASLCVRSKDHSLVFSINEIMSNPFHSPFVWQPWINVEPCTLMCRHCYVRTRCAL